jgi:uncharacterized lipoprotein YajG
MASEADGIAVADLMRASLANALKQAGLERGGDSAEDYLALNVTVVDYRPGNAFGRWLLPGLGATVLAVEGALVGNDGQILGRIRDERGVYAGGAYTIGAWKTIFDTVARDIVKGLQQRATRNGLVVTLDSWLKRDLVIPVASEKDRFVLQRVTDMRSDKSRIGERFAAFGVSMGDVHLFRPVTEYVKEMIGSELVAAGHQVAETGPGRAVSVEIKRFWVSTDTTPLYWDINSDIVVTVAAAGTPGAIPQEGATFSCNASTRTYTWPTKELVAGVVDECLLELMSEMRRSPIWRRG